MVSLKTLEYIGQSLVDLHEPWAITGGCSVFLHGCTRNPTDIDIITSRSGVKAIKKLLDNVYIGFLPISTKENVRSYFFSTKKYGTTIEVMGDPSNFVHAQWKENAAWRKAIRKTNYKGIPLNMTTLDYELYINSLLGNSERVALINKQVALIRNRHHFSTGHQPYYVSNLLL